MIVDVELEECVADKDDVEQLDYQKTHNQNTVSHTHFSVKESGETLGVK